MRSDDSESQSLMSARSGRSVLWLALLAFVLGIGVTALFISQYRQWLPKSAQGMFGSAAPGDAAAAINQGAGFEPPPEAGSAARAFDSDALNARQAAIAAQLTTLEARAATIDRDSYAAANNAARAEALLIAFAARRAIDRGLALGSIEPQLRLRFGTSQPGAIGAIIQASRAPVTLEDLRLALDANGPELATGAATDGWWTSLRRELSSLVVIRHEGTPSPRASDRLARVRRLLDAGQVEAAVTEVARLPGAPRATSWIAAARRYVLAHTALDTIETAAILGQGLQSAASAPGTAPAALATTAPATGPATGPALAINPPPAATTQTTATATLTP